ncbi:DegT/DnrJ/EryC1/StrS family aminotransferase [Streptosporangium sp. NBC_01469]|uniref:DegT/DnrJ/EryC1/StrS family aminotransferase n=1 Tax=Streptosporangium sp. NBC_01469 TaxID=2903898 RepID=UPI002E2AB534|nr:DegT/DnrJ/EryC1/StrS family aminotransferase [Streptosporangium sp. NBC_01469]
MTLPFPRRPKYGQPERDAVSAVMDSGRLSETRRGPTVAALEDTAARLVGTRYALSFNSGTASLHAALHAVGASPDAGVAMSPMTWMSAITAAFHAGSFPVFGDIEEGSTHLAVAALTGAAPNCSAAMVTHAWGIPAPMDDLTAATDLPIVEDCSHAHGALYRSRPVGAWGAAGCFSFQEAKAVSGGEGGIMTTSDHRVYEQALTLGHHPHRLAAELSLPDLLPLVDAGALYKFRMPALSAVIALQQLRTLPERMAASEENLTTLLQIIDGHSLPVTVPTVGSGSVRGWYGTPLTITRTVTDPEALRTTCMAEGIPLRLPYLDWLTTPLLQQPDLLRRFWPHLRGQYRPPQPEKFANYYQARRQMLVLKIPDVPAADYMGQVGAALVSVLTRTLGDA